MIREEQERFEREFLSESAAKSSETRGRARACVPCDIRTDFQRDRDRILHCRSFRMLKHKTQVFLAPEGDYFRTRLTHTLEVSQIARTISRALRLNEDLTEAIALGHDLGHTPFGHAGERSLRACAGAFEHNEQSLRIVDCLENGEGLNLTWEVRDGILNHKMGMSPATAEGTVVNISDRIAYLNHDIDDAINLGALDESRIPAHIVRALGKKHGQRIDKMIRDVIFTSIEEKMITMSREMEDITLQLRQFMFDEIYNSPSARANEEKTDTVIKMLYEHYTAHSGELKAEHVSKWGAARAVTDYIAGMSDRFALEKFSEIYVPKIWI